MSKDLHAALTRLMLNRKIKKSRWNYPYKADGSTNFPLRGKPGVYLIKKAGEIIYIGVSASDVYKTLYRHFQKWSDKRQIRISYLRSHAYSVRVLYCSPAQAAKLERALIVKHKPVDNPEKYEQYTLDLQDKKLITKAATAPVNDELGEGIDPGF